MPQQQIEEMLGSAEIEGCQVWPCNWKVIQAYLICATQWRFISGMHVARIGFDYAGCESALRMAKVELTREEFDDLQYMEIETIK